jgi:uncharacterized protein YjbI with pentapeptide repeats
LPAAQPLLVTSHTFYDVPMNPTGLADAYRIGERDFSGREFNSVKLSQLELFDCSFDGCTFIDSVFDRVLLSRCAFREAKFVRVSFSRALLTDSELRLATVVQCVVADTFFSRSDFTEAVFADALLRKSRAEMTSFESVFVDGVWFDDVEFRGCSFRGASISDCGFGNTALADISEAPDLTIRKCSVDWSSACRSMMSPHLENFLLRTGMPEVFAAYTASSAKSLDPAMLFKLMRSVFISYGGPDAPFARRLRDALQRNGVRTFFFDTDALPGTRLHTVMRDGVNQYDRIVLVCSAASLIRPGVLNEIEQALIREAAGGGESYIVPITVDDFVFRWAPPPDRAYLADEIRSRVVADFANADRDDVVFSAALTRLLKALAH